MQKWRILCTMIARKRRMSMSVELDSSRMLLCLSCLRKENGLLGTSRLVVFVRCKTEKGECIGLAFDDENAMSWPYDWQVSHLKPRYIYGIRCEKRFWSFSFLSTSLVLIFFCLSSGGRFCSISVVTSDLPHDCLLFMAVLSPLYLRTVRSTVPKIIQFGGRNIKWGICVTIGRQHAYKKVHGYR